VSGSTTLVSISAGHKHACGLAAGGSAYCWGENLSGQVGDGTHGYAGAPVPVTGGLTFASVSARGPSHSCGVTPDRAAYCWGANGFGQLGTVGDTSVSRPAPVSGGLRFASISAGFGHTCGITAQNRLYCWGYGGFGQLGTGTMADAHQPQAIVN
jgi:alpha-tubulin suppressor-like RCC1 family protein